MPRFFRFDFPPFNRLNPAEREQFVAALDIGYFPAGEVIVEAGEEPRHLHILIKGLVQEHRNGETVCLYGPDDNFDADALMQGRSISRFLAEEDVVSYMLPRKMFQSLLRKNIALASFYNQSLTDKLAAHEAEQNRFAMAPLLAAPLRETYLHPAIVVDPRTPLTEAAEIMRDKLASTLLVELPQGCGVITSTRLRNAVLIERLPIDTPVGEVAVANPVCIDLDAALSQAMLLMVERQIKRVVVKDGDTAVGVLDVTDLLSYLSNHAYLVFLQVARATDVEELKPVARQLPDVIRTLQHNGTRIPHITRLVSEVNRRLFAKLFELLAPPEVRANTCLVVMGSEGREEQILRADQDNALIVADGFDLEAARDFGRRFSATLKDFGFPACPGRMMTENPQWCRPLSEYRSGIGHWLHTLDEEAMVGISALADASAVAGDRDLLAALKRRLLDACSGEDAFLARFAKPVIAFETPLGLFHRLIVERGEHSGELDLKKGGLFPIMHGVRSLSLQFRIPQCNTVRRLEALRDAGLLEPRFTSDLIDAYEFMLGLKLKAGLNAVGSHGPGSYGAGSVGASGQSFIHTDSLSKFETDLLKDSLQLVKDFKNLVAHHFDLAHF